MNRPKPLGHVVKSISDPVFGKKSTLYSQIILNWTKIVGQSIASYSLPLGLKFKRTADKKHNSAILNIGVNSARAQDILMQKGLLIEKLNQFMGFSAIEDIQITHLSQNVLSAEKSQHTKNAQSVLSKSKKQEIHTHITPIKDHELKTALENLGNAIYTRQKPIKTLEHKKNQHHMTSEAHNEN